METQTIGQGIFYDHSKIKDKHFFGGFLNLAENNIKIVLKAFSEKFNVGQANLEQFADVSLKDNLSDSDFQKRVSFLKMYFPVIDKINTQNNRVQFRSDLTLLITSISKLRNFYTHFFHRPLDFDASLFILLDDIFARTARDVRDQKMKDDKTRHLLSQSLSEELEIGYQKQIERLKELKRQGKKVNVHDKEGIKNGVLNNAFNHLIYKDGESFKTKLAYSSALTSLESVENGIEISQSGLLFLLSMFLKRKEIEDLKSRSKGFKAKVIRDENDNVNGLKFMATHWVFSYLCFKGLKSKLSNEFHEETLLVQIIDELSKVPDELYVAFDKETKDKFIEDINEYIKEGNEDLGLERAKVVHPVIRKRYDNKFNYFAIRFLDEFVKFPSLRFQVHVGNYVHDKRLKNINGTTFQTERVVKDRIKVFGRLSEITSLKAQYLRTALNLSDEEGWEIFPNPSYVFIENNIPIYISTDAKFKREIVEFKNARRSQAPDELKIREAGKKRKFEITQMIGTKSVLNQEEPIALLSLNEIPALLYEILVNGKDSVEMEEIIKNKLYERLTVVKNYHPENPLPASQISRRLKKNQGNRIINTDKLLQLISKELIVTEQKLKLIFGNQEALKQKKDGKYIRKFVFTNLELGREAAWIADDVKRFMPQDSRKQWKGYQHSQLQLSLAFYNTRPKEALAILESNWNLKDETILWNEWILNSFKQNKFFDNFYNDYLEGRKKYFSFLSERISQYTSDSKNLQKFMELQMPKDLFDKRHYIMEDLQTEKHKILSKPFIFPRGIFDKKPTFIKGVKVEDSPESFAGWYSYGYQKDHQFQKFYDWARDYNDVFLEHMEKPFVNTGNRKVLGSNELKERIKTKQDLKIKTIKIQDLFLKLIAENLFQKVFNYSTTLILSDFYLTQEERIAKERAAASQSVREEGDNSPNIIKDNFLWSKTVPYQNGQIVEQAVRLKDIGKFNSFLSDEKIQVLLSYDKRRTWSKIELENEFYIGENSYEVIRREKLFKEIQKLEHEILILCGWNGFNHPVQLEHNNHPKFKIYLVNGILRKVAGLFNHGEDVWLEYLNESDFENLDTKTLESKSELIQLAYLLTAIRNKFAHNQLPSYQFYCYIRDKYGFKEEASVSLFYLNFVKYAISELKKIMM
ncbi:type VI-B CRISPR-associated RNA-guided ribonuclease Cas13b [Chryseobacterium sp. CKR4-1]|uniref:type VI-B CRISPR-associated RNA-guided ribonuclease Cas13b n=1 Tax=Chryseobacterium sp. CKR4-1 TaxID=3068896 RepID=UPI002796CB73|nr:type VI-B CRISPR-associated RNA-guided ribonuclease Cas13b [Chryseobacterium sp. CKR4-1]MDQ1803100.1 type VI-B CRISPR-associated RNA-guided ribonuclease Cas13b [Chryseobacterium sp. CKR4-1]